jgi:hypothetical protein
MFTSPENKGMGEEMNLDFTNPADKLKNVEEKIAAAKRGIILAMDLKDEKRVEELEEKLKDFETTRQILEAGMDKNVKEEEDADAFSQAVRGANGGSIGKMEKRGF